MSARHTGRLIALQSVHQCERLIQLAERGPLLRYAGKRFDTKVARQRGHTRGDLGQQALGVGARACSSEFADSVQQQLYLVMLMARRTRRRLGLVPKAS